MFIQNYLVQSLNAAAPLPMLTELYNVDEGSIVCDTEMNPGLDGSSIIMQHHLDKSAQSVYGLIEFSTV